MVCAQLETAVLNSLKLVPVSALAKIDEISQLDFCFGPIKVVRIKFPRRQKRFDSYWRASSGRE